MDKRVAWTFIILGVLWVLSLGFAFSGAIDRMTEAGTPTPLSVSPIQSEGLPPIGPSVETDGWQIAPKGYIEYCKNSPSDCK